MDDIRREAEEYAKGYLDPEGAICLADAFEIALRERDRKARLEVLELVLEALAVAHDDSRVEATVLGLMPVDAYEEALKAYDLPICGEPE